MKNSRTLAVGILLGVMAILSLGIVYIDTTSNFWRFSGGFIQLVVNTNAVPPMVVDTNTLRIGFNTNNSTHSIILRGRTPTNAPGTTGVDSSTIGAIQVISGDGGASTNTTSATSGNAGDLTLQSGRGADASVAVTNSIGGNGGTLTFQGGQGGNHLNAGVATNNAIGGNGGTINVLAGAGGRINQAATNAVSGDGGNITFQGGGSQAPASGWSRKPGSAGSISISGGSGSSGTRTNGGSGGSFTATAGSGGNNSTTPGNGGAAGTVTFIAGNGASAAAGGNPSPGGNVVFTAGDGSTGDTNSNGGRIHLIGGSPGSGAVAGDVVIARNTSGTSRGGLMVGPLVGGAVSITNVLGAAASLDFPNTVAGTFSDLPITVTGATSNNVAVCLSTPWMCATNGGSYFTYASNDTIYVRFLNHNLVSAIDPVPGTFSVVGFRIR